MLSLCYLTWMIERLVKDIVFSINKHCENFEYQCFCVRTECIKKSFFDTYKVHCSVEEFN